MPQEPILFDDSIRENITFGQKNITDHAVWEALKLVKLFDLFQGYDQKIDSKIGERGSNLSGGQKQRVSIARAFIKSPEILLLDDCLSAVDTETEEQILNNIELVTKEKTTIIVSHRISSAKNADKIIVLDSGKIVEICNHKELVAKRSFYKKFIDMQSFE